MAESGVSTVLAPEKDGGVSVRQTSLPISAEVKSQDMDFEPSSPGRGHSQEDSGILLLPNTSTNTVTSTLGLDQSPSLPQTPGFALRPLLAVHAPRFSSPMSILPLLRFTPHSKSSTAVTQSRPNVEGTEGHKDAHIFSSERSQRMDGQPSRSTAAQTSSSAVSLGLPPPAEKKAVQKLTSEQQPLKAATRLRTSQPQQQRKQEAGSYSGGDGTAKNIKNKKAQLWPRTDVADCATGKQGQGKRKFPVKHSSGTHASEGKFPQKHRTTITAINSAAQSSEAKQQQQQNLSSRDRGFNDSVKAKSEGDAGRKKIASQRKTASDLKAKTEIKKSESDEDTSLLSFQLIRSSGTVESKTVVATGLSSSGPAEFESKTVATSGKGSGDCQCIPSHTGKPSIAKIDQHGVKTESKSENLSASKTTSTDKQNKAVLSKDIQKERKAGDLLRPLSSRRQPQSTASTAAGKSQGKYALHSQRRTSGKAASSSYSTISTTTTTLTRAAAVSSSTTMTAACTAKSVTILKLPPETNETERQALTKSPAGESPAGESSDGRICESEIPSDLLENACKNQNTNSPAPSSKDKNRAKLSKMDDIAPNPKGGQNVRSEHNQSKPGQSRSKCCLTRSKGRETEKSNPTSSARKRTNKDVTDEKSPPATPVIKKGKQSVLPPVLLRQVTKVVLQNVRTISTQLIAAASAKPPKASKSKAPKESASSTENTEVTEQKRGVVGGTVETQADKKSKSKTESGKGEEIFESEIGKSGEKIQSMLPVDHVIATESVKNLEGAKSTTDGISRKTESKPQPSDNEASGKKNKKAKKEKRGKKKNDKKWKKGFHDSPLSMLPEYIPESDSRLNKHGTRDVYNLEKLFSGQLGKDEMVQDTVKPKISRRRPNYFYAVQISDKKIKEGLSEVLDSVAKAAPKLTPAFIPVDTVHITLAVMHLPDLESVQRAASLLDKLQLAMGKGKELQLSDQSFTMDQQGRESSDHGMANGPVGRPMSPVDKPAKPVDTPATPLDTPATLVDTPATPVDRPSSKPVDKLATSVDRPVTLVDKLAPSMNGPSSPLDKPATPVDSPPLPVDQPATPVDKPQSQIGRPQSSVDRPPSPAEKPAKAADKPALPADKPSALLDNSVTVSVSTSAANTDQVASDIAATSRQTQKFSEPLQPTDENMLTAGATCEEAVSVEEISVIVDEQALADSKNKEQSCVTLLELAERKALKPLPDLVPETLVSRDAQCDNMLPPMPIVMQGLGNFNDAVVFAKISKGAAVDRLANIAEFLRQGLVEEDISVETKKFEPHATIMKMSKNPVKLKKAGIRKIHREMYADYNETTFGVQEVLSVQLCSMLKPKKDGYYFVEHHIPCAPRGGDDDPVREVTPTPEKSQDGLKAEAGDQVDSTLHDKPAEVNSVSSVVDRTLSELSKDGPEDSVVEKQKAGCEKCEGVECASGIQASLNVGPDEPTDNVIPTQHDSNVCEKTEEDK